MKKRDMEKMNTIAVYTADYKGIELKHIEHGIEDIFYIMDGTQTSNPTAHKLKVYYNDKGAYVRLNGSRLYAAEFLKIN